MAGRWLDDGGSYESGTRTFGEAGGEALIEAKDETIRVLMEQLDAKRRANEENRRIIAGLTQRIPQLEAPQQDQDQASAAAPDSAVLQSLAGCSCSGSRRRIIGNYW